MTIKKTLALKPNDYNYQSLMAKFADGAPLSCEQLNFLAWHEKSLSNPHLDPVMKYYLKHYHRQYSEDHSFLLPSEILNKENIARLKQRLQLLLQTTKKHVELKFTPEQFKHLKTLAYNELILLHGNHFLSGAPFHPGGIPHIIFFQWGNLFGVAKYVVLAEEKALKSNVLIYFEDMGERLLNECVHDYQQTHANELKNQQQLQLSSQINPQLTAQPTTSYSTPRPSLSLSRNKEVHDSDK